MSSRRVREVKAATCARLAAADKMTVNNVITSRRGRQPSSVPANKTQPACRKWRLCAERKKKKKAEHCLNFRRRSRISSSRSVVLYTANQSKYQRLIVALFSWLCISEFQLRRSQFANVRSCFFSFNFQTSLFASRSPRCLARVSGFSLSFSCYFKSFDAYLVFFLSVKPSRARMQEVRVLRGTQLPLLARSCSSKATIIYYITIFFKKIIILQHLTSGV